MKNVRNFDIFLLMRKILILLIIISIFSCGAIMDEQRVVGKWKLKTVEFYVQNNDFDAVKTYTGENDNYPTENHPCESEFFAEKIWANYYITFDKNNDIKIERKVKDADDAYTYIDYKDAEWAISSFENSLTVKVDDNSTASGFWRDDFSFTNSWAMPNYETLELTIKAKDVGKSYFHIDLTDDKTIKVTSMKGIFKKD